MAYKQRDLHQPPANRFLNPPVQTAKNKIIFCYTDIFISNEKNYINIC